MSDLVGNHEDKFSNDAAQMQSNEPQHEKTNVLVSDVVRHKPGCTATEDGERLEISDLERRGSENKGADQLHGYSEADLRLCVRICKTLVFS